MGITLVIHGDGKVSIGYICEIAGVDMTGVDIAGVDMTGADMAGAARAQV